jgi:hypothetical protein
MPQPVDLQTEMARMSATERIQQATDHASLAAQQRVAAEAQKEQVSRETEVTETQETQSEEVDAEERRREERRSRRRHKLPGDADEESGPGPDAQSGEGSRLDVSV